MTHQLITLDEGVFKFGAKPFSTIFFIMATDSDFVEEVLEVSLREIGFIINVN